MVEQAGSMTEAAWREWDRLVVEATTASPWSTSEPAARYAPDYDLLTSLLTVPVRLGASTQSGLPAKAVDVWLAHELRRCGFAADEVWPRPSVPRVVPREVGLLRKALPKKLSEQLFARIDAGQVRGGVTSADANVLGKAYVKQVDVGMACQVVGVWQVRHEHQSLRSDVERAGGGAQTVFDTVRTGPQPQDAVRHLLQDQHEARECCRIEFVTVVETGEHRAAFGQPALSA